MSSQWSAAGSGALGGGALGAKLGSAFGPIGTGIGAGIGALGGGLSGYFGATPDKNSQISTQNPQQQQALSQLLGNLQQSGGQDGNYQSAQDYLGKLLNRDPGTYDRFAAPYMQQFEQQTLPMLAERFAGLGGGLGGGSLSSSGFGQAIGGAGAGLQANLANLFAQLQRGAASDATGQYNQLAQLGLGQRTFENTYQPGSTGIGGALGSSVAGNQARSIQSDDGNDLISQIMSYINGDKRTGIDSGASGQ